MIARFKNNLRNKNKTFKKCDVKIKNHFLIMNYGIVPKVLEQIAQCNLTRIKIKILLENGYSYSTIQNFFHCASKTIYAVNCLIAHNAIVIDVKRGPKIKITPEIKEIVLNENFSHPDMCLRNLSSFLKDEHRYFKIVN